MEIERNLSMTKGSLLKSIVGDISMNNCNTSIQDLSDNDIVEILVRLPVKTIIHCKCVCRDWLNLITESHFINLHLTKSPECFMLFDDDYSMDPETKPPSLRLLEIQEEHGHNHLHHDPIMSLDLNLVPVFQISPPFAEGSVNGLICLVAHGYKFDKIYICNPITREYMTLSKKIDSREAHIENSYGFGVSCLTGEYKVIRIFQDKRLYRRAPYAEIYTLGTGKWRSLGHVTYSTYGCSGTFLNNHLHWSIYDYEDPHKKIVTFDFDNETFQLFPPSPVGLKQQFDEMLGVLKGCLCYSYRTYEPCEFTIWVMKEYGIGNSWQKEVVINQSICPNMVLSWLALGGSLKDGSILMVYGPGKLMVYHPDTNTMEETEFSYVYAINFRPSFVKLQNFESESVYNFPNSQDDAGVIVNTNGEMEDNAEMMLDDGVIVNPIAEMEDV